MGTDTRAASLLVGCARRDGTGPARGAACGLGARGAARCRVGVVGRAGRVVVGGHRRCQFGVALPRWSARPLGGLCGGDLVGRRSRSGLVRAGARLAAAGVDRGAVVRVVSVALADLCGAQPGADGARRADVARGAHRRVRGVRLHLVPVGRGSDTAPCHVGSRPFRCRRARRGRRRRGRAAGRPCCRIRPVRSPSSTPRPSPPAAPVADRADIASGDQPGTTARRRAAPAPPTVRAAAASHRLGRPPPVRPAPLPTTTTVAVPLQEIHSVMWTGDSVSFDLAPGVVRVVDRCRPRRRRVSGRTTDCG